MLHEKRSTPLPVAVLLIALAVATAACNRTEREAEPAATTAPPSATTAGPQGDSAISTAVQARYYTEDATRGQQIDVAAENGVVTLRGTVQSDAAKERAAEIARNVEGVARVENELEVREPAAASASGQSETPATTGTAGTNPDPALPAWITTKIQAQYFIDPDIKPWNINVTTASSGVVTLEGQVDSPEDKAEALRIARETEGVTRVEDRLRVEAKEASRTEAGPSAAEPAVERPDPWITAKIQAQYFVDGEVKARNIDVDTREGMVTLAGSVTSEAERRQAVAIARNTEGVRDVTDKLRVGAGEAEGDRAAAEPMKPVKALERPDPWITTKIQSKYFLDADVKGHEINVDTREGVVTLKGTVQTADQKTEAEQIAAETEGVKRVVNQLTVGAAPGA